MLMTADSESIPAARRVIARHRRRTGTTRCGFCGGIWHNATATGPVAGCAARRFAGEALLAAGVLIRVPPGARATPGSGTGAPA